MKLVNPANKRKYKVIVVGTGLAGASAAATLAELGYNVTCFCFQDSPRRAHSIAAQGGINAAKNYQNDGDSVYRLFYDTVKGGDFRAREANVYRLAEVTRRTSSTSASRRACRSRASTAACSTTARFGGAQVSRTFYARGQTGQQLLLGAYQALARQIGAGQGEDVFARTEMLDLVVVDGRARGIVARDLVTGEIESHAADAVVLATGGYGNVFYLSTNAKGCNVTAIWRAHKRGALFANPCFTQIHPTCIPVSGRLPVEAHADVASRCATTAASGCRRRRATTRPPAEIPEAERDYYLERKYPSFGNLAPRDIASRAAKEVCDEGRGVGPGRARRLPRLRRRDRAAGRAGRSRERTATCSTCTSSITGENPYKVPMRIYPAVHYTMGGLWVDYNLMSTIPGLFVLGEANFSDHGANRLGASALMQGLADGYFVLPYTIGDYLAGVKPGAPAADHAEVKAAEADVEAQVKKLLAIKGKRTAASFHRELGKLMWEKCGMARNEAGLKEALARIPELRGRVLGERGACRARPTSSTRRSRRPAAWPTSSSSPSCMCRDALQRARVVRRPLPRGAPDRRRRGEARRRELLPRRGLGVDRRRQAAGPSRGAARLRERPARHAELQVMKLTLNVWRQKDGKSGGGFADLRRSRASASTCRSSRCSTSSTRS